MPRVRIGHRRYSIPSVTTVAATFVLGLAVAEARGQVFDPDVHGLGLSMADYMRDVPGGGQPGGPAYSFEMGKYEITNAQFAAFLNDAQLDGGATGRGSNMFFDPDGRVRASDGGPTLFRSSPGVVPGRINYDPNAPLGMRYSARTINGVDYSPHPVTQVSWLGAVKFSNWLTIDQGLGERQRVYTEGPNTEDWHPATISTTDWAVRDLNAAERETLVDNFMGFRLPMDDQSATASAFNEFFKAGAWAPDAQVNRLYGFGRDTIDVFDANYEPATVEFGDPRNPFHVDPASGDWTNPVGFFDGSLRQQTDWNWAGSGQFGVEGPLAATFQTRANENAFGIFDVSGNVLEFQQDQLSVLAGVIIRRGGHFGSTENGVLTDSRATQVPEGTDEFTGFRLVRVPEPASVCYLLSIVAFVGLRRSGR